MGVVLLPDIFYFKLFKSELLENKSSLNKQENVLNNLASTL